MYQPAPSSCLQLLIDVPSAGMSERKGPTWEVRRTDLSYNSLVDCSELCDTWTELSCRTLLYYHADNYFITQILGK